jgi:hypothetical protein
LTALFGLTLTRKKGPSHFFFLPHFYMMISIFDAENTSYLHLTTVFLGVFVVVMGYKRLYLRASLSVEFGLYKDAVKNPIKPPVESWA